MNCYIYSNTFNQLIKKIFQQGRVVPFLIIIDSYSLSNQEKMKRIIISIQILLIN